MNINDDKLVQRTYNKDCPACVEKRVHSGLEWKEHHPLAGTGLDNRDSPPKQAKAKLGVVPFDSKEPKRSKSIP